MNNVIALGVTELDAFVRGLKHDFDAVKNAIITDYSNGIIEGHINKIKVIKRIMYGRCHFETLKNKCLFLEHLY